MSMFVCVFDCFALTSAFICAVAVYCLFLFVLFYFLIRRFPYNCYYYYCIVTIVSLFYCIFIWQLWRHVVHYKKKNLIISLYAYTYIQVKCIYKCMYHDCKV